MSNWLIGVISRRVPQILATVMPLFPAASYLYVLLGMGFQTEYRAGKPSAQRQAQQLFAQNQQKCRQLVAALDSNRVLLEKVARYGFSKI